VQNKGWFGVFGSEHLQVLDVHLSISLEEAQLALVLAISAR
jgi:hypothetical protein